LAFAEKSQLVESLKNAVTETKVLLVFLMIPFTISTGYLIKKLVDKYQERKRNIGAN